MVFSLLLKSIFSNDVIILIAAMFTAFFLMAVRFLSSAVKKNVKDWKNKRNKPFSKFVVKNLSKYYTIFTTAITIFPLLGMLGTVFGLLGLDLSTGDMTNIKNNFFIALTSTAWGIIFSVFFKIVHAFVADGIEEQIDIAKKLSEDVD